MKKVEGQESSVKRLIDLKVTLSVLDTTMHAKTFAKIWKHTYLKKKIKKKKKKKNLINIPLRTCLLA